MGVTKPEILLTADPALTLDCAPPEKTDSVLLQAGIPTGGRYLCFALRKWKGFEEKAPVFAAAAEYAYNRHGLTPVFLAVENRQDPLAAAIAAQGVSVPHYFLNDAGKAGTIIGALSRMQVVVSMMDVRSLTRVPSALIALTRSFPAVAPRWVGAIMAHSIQECSENFKDLVKSALKQDAPIRWSFIFRGRRTFCVEVVFTYTNT